METVINRKLGCLIKKEEGFTFIEIIIVVVIIGVLAAIGLLVFSKQTEAAIVATVKSDVAANKSQIVNERPTSTNNRRGLYIEPTQFADKAVRTSENTVGYTVSPDHTQACTWGSYRFSDDNIFYYHFSTETGKMVEGECDSIDGWLTAIVTPEGETTQTETGEENSNPNSPEDELEEPEEPGEEEEEETHPYGFYVDGPLNLDLRLTTNGQNKICFSAEVSTESTTPVEWAIKIDRTVEPIRGNNFGSEIKYNGVGKLQEESALATITNQPHIPSTVVAGSPITVPNICIYGLNVSNAGVMRTPQQVNFVPQPVSGGAWSASQSFTITGTGEFWGIWEGEVDLSELDNTANRASGSVRLNNSQYLKMEHISGHRYKVTLQDVPGNMYRLVKLGETQTITFQK